MASIVDQIINGTFANPAMQTQGWGQPVGNVPREGTVNSPYLRQGASGVRFNPGEGFVPGSIPVSAPPPMQASSPPAWTNNGPAMFQIGSELARSPATRYAVDANGQRIDPIRLGYGGTPPQNPAVTAAEQLVMPPLPRPRPPNAPNWMDMAAINAQTPKGANPGMGGAIIGNGHMSPMIPPQLPPADGSSPLPVWAGDNPQQGGPLLINVRGGQAPNLTPAQRYALANQTGQINAQQRQSQATGQAGGYQYRNGQHVGYAPQTIGGRTYTPHNGAAAYGLANAAGQIAALNRQATATGQTGVYNYVNGVRTGTVNGQSGANAYAAANAGPGSVAEWERRASGNQSGGGGPAGGYASGGR